MDADGDGFNETVDCDDSNAAINPGETESCNGVDDNCNTTIDEGLVFLNYYTDADADGYGDASATAVNACQAPAGLVLGNTDCNDANANINPGAAEVCNNNTDDNCNGNGDETAGSDWYADTDNDGFGNAASSIVSCTTPVGYVLTSNDCDDTAVSINPSATEVCGNGVDEDCSGSDLNCGGGVDADGDGFSSPIDCNDNNASIYPGATEICFDNQDNNCSGVVDEGCISNVDADGDGFVAGFDCNDANPAINPASAEFCNDLDDDCDGIVDDSTGVVFYQDADADLLGNINATFLFCSQPANGWVSNADDCDDSSSSLLGPGTPCDNGSTLDELDTYQIDCTCQGLLLGCTDPEACNYNVNAMIDDGSCESSTYIPGVIDGNEIVETYSYHNYSYTGNLNGVTLLWTLNSPGIFIPVSNTATTPSVNVYWSEGNGFDPQGEITLLVTDTSGGCNAQFEITFNVEFDTTSTGVNGIDNQDLVAWPNPSNGNFAVLIPNEITNQYDISVYSMTGDIVYTAHKQTDRVWNAQLNLSSGLYMIKIVGEQEQHFVNVVIEK